MNQNENITSYKNCYVAFIDILGFKEYVKNQKCNVVLDTLSIIQKLGKEGPENERLIYSTENGIEIRCISDSVIISIEEDTCFPLEAIVNLCASFQVELLLSKGLTMRGGIGYGDFYIKDNILFGTAYQEAVGVEKDHNSPSIILGNSIDISKTTDQNYLMQDKESGRWFVNFMYPAILQDNLYFNKIKFAKKAILENLDYFKKHNCQKNVDKYIWLTRYFNQSIGEKPELSQYIISDKDLLAISCLGLQTSNRANENFDKLKAIFPNAITEAINGAGELVRAIDADVLRQEISAEVVEGSQERYQFTWPDKKKSVVLANAPIAKTLRLDRSKSVGRDGTRGSIDSENIYIEGDNLDALKLLQETYLGKVKMIYIDPPYNTGNDFIYEDDFSQGTEEYLANSGQCDDEGNRLVQNSESNGRFHTDWLNMLYPRLRIARDLLSDDGAIFISIDDNEQENLKKCCNEIFGAQNFVAQLVWEKKKKGAFLSKNHINMKEYIVVYAKHNASFNGLIGEITSDTETYPCIKTTNARGVRVIRKGTPSKYKEKNYKIVAGTRVSSGNMELIYLDDVIVVNGVLQEDIRIDSNWIYGQSALDKYASYGLIYITQDNYIRRIVKEERTKMLKDLLTRVGSDGKSLPTFTYDVNLNNGGWGTNEDANDELHMLFGQQYLFDFSKPTRLIAKLIQSVANDNSIIMDFFSGSATTAQGVMQLNAEDGGNRKFIMVQLPEITNVKSEAHKTGYETICDIGEERIRRAGDKIRQETGAEIDYGFRVFRVDSSNMQDVYYTPAEYNQTQMDILADNIKSDRTPEDLLFQVMLDLGVLLSSSIEETVIAGKKVFVASEPGAPQIYLIACFDKNVTEETVTEIAKRRPFYAVFRDNSMATDSVATNFEQIFATYSPQTVRRVL